ncbi:hypothetical protein BLNAU_1858 [Blattamonas nauphoetae]|uniref:Uncharacterized protein n=1 Tax=Blattamonas nauphoetae TaxID=2049346 RepID=A0ABQ9YHU2_9EUKA|nr:hypothetical protein BLNAU_1858 [Blattamonas nauphoetae]
MNESRFQVTQGASSYAKARRGGRNQLVLPRRQGPPPSKQKVDIMADEQVRLFIEENSTPSSEAQVRTRRASNLKQRALNGLSDFAAAKIMAEPSSPNLFRNFVSPEVHTVALGGPTQSPSSPAFLQNFVSPTVLNLAIQNPHPTPPLNQPPEPRLIQKTKKELSNEMRAQNLIQCSCSTFTKQTKHLKRVKRRTDLCHYCETGKGSYFCHKSAEIHETALYRDVFSILFSQFHEKVIIPNKQLSHGSISSNSDR